MKRAIATLVIGKHYQDMFGRWCLPAWRNYAKKHNIDIIIIDAPIDTTARAQHRSPAWQKCILHRDKRIRDYDQIAWIDADIRINPHARNIFEDCPQDKVSAVDAYGTPNREDHGMLLRRLYKSWDAAGVKYISNLTPAEYHGHFGLKSSHDHVIQTGVLVFTPSISADIFERVYNNYEDKGPSYWNYEMRPLSYEILETGLANWLNPKFNMPWSFYEQFYYPFLSRKKTWPERLLCKLGFKSHIELIRKECVRIAFRNNFFLHFAGESRDYILLDPTENCLP